MRQRPRQVLQLIVLAVTLTGMCLVGAAPAGADTPARNRAYVVESPGGLVALEMTPAEDRGESGRGQGVAKDKATGRVLWTLDWYASKGKALPLDDGLSLIRFGPWARDRQAFSDLAVAFYRQGREVRRYQVADLLRRPDKILRTASHYFWMDRVYALGMSPDQGRLTIFLIDGGVAQFATDSGQRLEPTDLANMRAARRLFAQAEQRRGHGDQRGALPLYRQSLRLWPNLFLEAALKRMR
ncbi:MAG: hypothetical protein V1806_06155 [Pseudomonadota bacterium]